MLYFCTCVQNNNIVGGEHTWKKWFEINGLLLPKYLVISYFQINKYKEK
jgi:hypothetical protein